MSERGKHMNCTRHECLVGDPSPCMAFQGKSITYDIVSEKAAEVEASLDTGIYVIVRGPGRLAIFPKMFKNLDEAKAHAEEKAELEHGEDGTEFQWTDIEDKATGIMKGSYSQLFGQSYDRQFRVYIQKMELP